MTKYIFVTGGVVSGLGKGITAASLGRLLKMRGLKVAAQTGVLLLVRAEQYPDVTARVCQSGVLTLQKPTSPAIFSSTLQLLCATRARLRRMEQKTATLEEKMAEIRLVNRAKWVLIEQLKMTENEAHKFIERQAMDRCVTRRTIAENILATYK